MAAKEVIFLVSGKRKAAILKRILAAKKPTSALPATILKHHPRCHWIVDADAAQELC
jgi:6-phosphogluconolactonase/glucosamine-6-phosphate isomerase/deaminase